MIAVTEPDQQRPGQVDADPSARLEEVLHLLDELTEVAGLSEGLFRAIEHVTGLRVGEIQVLRAVTRSGAEVHDVASRVGQPDDAVNATVDGLVERGLFRRDRRAGPNAVLRLTGAGTAALEQTQGVQIRLLDTLVAEVGADGARAFRTTLHGIAGVLRTLARRTGTAHTGNSPTDSG
jgi:DNA-binding MarR family transcriptional regulator